MPMDNRLMVPRRNYDADTLRYLNAVQLADGQALEPEIQAAVDAFVRGCKADGIFSAIKASCIMCGARTISGALVPLAGTAPTAVNFVSANYNRETGLVGVPASSTRIDLQNIYPDGPSQNSSHQSVYVTSQTSLADYVTHIRELDDAGLAGDGQTQISQKVGSTFTRSREGVGSTLVAALQTGLVGTSRQGASGYSRRAGGSTASVTAASGGVPSGDGHVYYNGSGQYSDARLAFYSIGSALDLAALDNRVSTLVAAIAAAL